MHLLSLAFLTSFFLGFSSLEKSETKELRPGKDYALFFAIDDYDEWRDLRHPILEAEEIAGDLRQHYGFEVKVIKNARSDQIFQWLKTYREKTYAKEDQLFIFFSGHGYFIEDTEEGFIIPKDGKTNDPFQRSYIPHSRLEKAIDNIPCRHILLAIDACYSGTFDEEIASRGGRWQRPDQGKDENDLFIQRSLQYQGRQYLTSGGKEQTPDRSKFALQLKLALRTYGGPDGILTINEIETFLEKVYPIPRSGYFGDHEGGNFLFVMSDYQSTVSKPSRAPADTNSSGEDATERVTSTSAFPKKGSVNLKGSNYNTIQFQAGGLIWMTENLNYEVPDSWCYENKSSNCEKYGRLYTWEAAKQACRVLGNGWRLPTDQEWRDLTKRFGGGDDDATDGGKTALAALINGGNSGFNALLGGWRGSTGSFVGLGAGSYWSATRSDAVHAWSYGFYRILNKLTRNEGSTSFGYACRCVRGAPSGE